MMNHIIEWNRERGLLDTFDPCLELKMLSEEAREFYNATTFEHTLAEAADFIFVLEGTKAKYHCNCLDGTVIFEINYRRFEQLMAWANSIKDNMESLLECEAKMIHNLRYSKVKHLIGLALAAVIDCNNKKPNKKAGGKVVKGESHVNPVGLIYNLIYTKEV